MRRPNPSGDDFDRLGYLLLPGVIPADELDDLRREVVTHLRDRAGARDGFGRSSRLWALALDSRVTRELPGHLAWVRGVLFDKTPQRNWPVAWHQDLSIALRERRDVPGYGPWSEKEGIPHVQPPVDVLESMVTVRLHLDDTPAENGALRVIPGTHRLGRIGGPEMIRLAERAVAVCSCRAGDLLMMRPLLLHSSPRADRPRHRRVIHLEYADGEILHPHLSWRTCVSICGCGD